MKLLRLMNMRRKMSCKNVKELLSPYIDGELSDTERKTFESHIELCAGCRTEFQETERLHNLFAGADKHSAPYGFSARVVENLDQKSGRKNVLAPLLTRFAETMVVFLVIAVGMVSGSFVAGIISLPRSAPLNSEAVLLSLEEFNPAPPDSLGGIYLAITGGSNEE